MNTFNADSMQYVYKFGKWCSYLAMLKNIDGAVKNSEKFKHINMLRIGELEEK